MAERALKKVEDQLSCSICLDTYRNPKLLQCFHVFCQQCLVKLVVRDQQGELVLTCPICRHDTPVPANGVAGLQPAFQINHLLEIMEEHKKAAEDIPADEAKGPSSLNASGCDPDMTKICCREHADRKVELYCETCGELVCLKCGLKGGKHHSHEYEELGPAFEKYKVQVTQSLEPLEKQLTTVNKALADVSTQSVKTSSQGEAVEMEVHAVFERIQQVLDARKADLVDQVHRITNGKLKKLAAQRDQLETTQSQLTSCLEYMKESLETSHHEEVLSMKTDLVGQMTELCAKIPLKLLKPSVKTDMTFSASESIVTVCRNYGHVSTQDLTDPSKSHVAGKGIELAEVGKVSTALLYTINFNCHPCSVIPFDSSEVELVSEITGTRTKGYVEKREDGLYEISYQPTIKGRHRLHVRIEGQPVRGSPFSISAKSPVEVLSAPILTIDQVRKPYGVAINQRGEVIVSEFIAHCVSVFSHEGERLRPFSLMQSVHFKYPRSVAVDGEGNLYVTDNRQVQKFTAEGNFLAAVGSEENGPYNGISINPVNKKLYVTSKNNNVLVLSPDLSHVFSFGKHGSGKGHFDRPHGVACDSTGRVLVCDSRNNRVQVFTAEGKFLKVFGTHRGAGGGTLKHPQGIAVDTSSDMVYISDERDCVSVFASDGSLVTSFGSAGTQPGQFQGAFGVAVDPSGVVYVCDFVNFRVQLF